jgi:hypothetical protein
MSCANEGCEFPEGFCLFDEMCDDLEADLLVEMALGCLAVEDDAQDEEEDDGDLEIEIPVTIIANTLARIHGINPTEVARDVLSDLTKAGWTFKR